MVARVRKFYCFLSSQRNGSNKFPSLQSRRQNTNTVPELISFTESIDFICVKYQVFLLMWLLYTKRQFSL